jgi:hypothetical protein
VIETVDGELKSYHRSQVNFRPIRTKEQQERESAITKARNACPYPGSESTKIDVEALYDAGMLRKEAE